MASALLLLSESAFSLESECSWSPALERAMKSARSRLKAPYFLVTSVKLNEARNSSSLPWEFRFVSDPTLGSFYCFVSYASVLSFSSGILVSSEMSRDEDDASRFRLWYASPGSLPPSSRSSKSVASALHHQGHTRVTTSSAGSCVLRSGITFSRASTTRVCSGPSIVLK